MEGRNIQYDVYNAQGDWDRPDVLAEKLTEERRDLIVAAPAASANAVARSPRGKDAPLIFLSVADPTQLAKRHPDSSRNLTGISASTIDLTEKRIELLKELVPGVKKAIAIHNPRGPNYENNLQATRAAARRLGLNLTEVTFESRDELIERAPAVLTRKAGEAVIYPPDRIATAVQTAVFPLLLRERLPTIAASVGSVYAGALATYAADYVVLGQQGATLAESIFKGFKPGDSPIQQPFKLKLVVNLKSAKAINLKVPKGLLLRADKVIE